MAQHWPEPPRGSQLPFTPRLPFSQSNGTSDSHHGQQWAPWSGPKPPLAGLVPQYSLSETPDGQRTRRLYEYAITSTRSANYNLDLSLGGQSSSHVRQALGAASSAPALPNPTIVDSGVMGGMAAAQDPTDESVQANVPRSARKARARQPSDALWQQHAPEIEKLYMRDDQTLPEVMKKMREEHGFNATKKMYKDKFKIWKWHKNLPRKKAEFMLNRITQRKPEKIRFTYGNQTWTEDRIKQVCERYEKDGSATNDTTRRRQLEAASAYGPTPSDIEYSSLTPFEVRTPMRLADSTRDKGKGPAEFARSQPDFTGLESFDRVPVGYDWTIMTLADLRTISESAATLADEGNSSQAEDQFLDSFLGFRHLLSPTHDETNRAGYRFASFYASEGRMKEACSVLHWMGTKHHERWGPSHEQTLLHYTRVIELLRSWGRREMAELVISRMLDNITDSEGILDGLISCDRLGRGSNANKSSEAFEMRQRISNLGRATDASTINHQLKLIDILLSANVTDLSEVLMSIIEQCEKGPGNLTTQVIQARAALAKAYASTGLLSEAREELQAARRLILPHLTVDGSIPHTLVSATQKVAYIFLEIDDCSASVDLLETLVGVYKAKLGIVKDGEAEYFVLDLLVNIAFEFRRLLSWDSCSPWIEQALQVARRAFGCRSKDAQRFEKMLAQQSLDSVNFTSTYDLMKSSKGLFRIRLV